MNKKMTNKEIMDKNKKKKKSKPKLNCNVTFSLNTEPQRRPLDWKDKKLSTF